MLPSGMESALDGTGEASGTIGLVICSTGALGCKMGVMKFSILVVW